MQRQAARVSTAIITLVASVLLLDHLPVKAVNVVLQADFRFEIPAANLWRKLWNSFHSESQSCVRTSQIHDFCLLAPKRPGADDSLLSVNWLVAECFLNKFFEPGELTRSFGVLRGRCFVVVSFSWCTRICRMSAFFSTCSIPQISQENTCSCGVKSSTCSSLALPQSASSLKSVLAMLLK